MYHSLARSLGLSLGRVALRNVARLRRRGLQQTRVHTDTCESRDNEGATVVVAAGAAVASLTLASAAQTRASHGPTNIAKQQRQQQGLLAALDKLNWPRWRRRGHQTGNFTANALARQLAGSLALEPGGSKVPPRKRSRNAKFVPHGLAIIMGSCYSLEPAANLMEPLSRHSQQTASKGVREQLKRI